MTQTGPTCREGWELPELLAYVEGEMPEPAGRSLALHLRSCAVCSSEVESLRKLHGLLRSHPESFHPDAGELFRFVSTGSDPEAWIAEHVDTCPECREDVELVRQMIAVGPESPRSGRAMPESLIRRLKALHGVRKGRGRASNLLSHLKERTRTWFRPPVLALGTAAAMVIIAVLILPRWDTLHWTIQRARVAPLEESAPKEVTSVPLKKGHPAPPHEMLPEPKKAGETMGAASQMLRRDKEVPEKDIRRLERPAVPVPEEHEGVTEPASAPVGGVGEAAQPTETDSRAGSPATLPEPALQQRAKPHAKARVGLKQSYPAVRAAPSAPLQTEIPVTVEIVNSEGAVVPWLEFVPPQGLPSVFRFSDARGRAPVGVTAKPEKEIAYSARPAELALKGLLVRFTIAASGATFDVQAELFERGATQPSKSLVAAQVSKSDLTTQISSMTASLLSEFSTEKEPVKRGEQGKGAQ